MSGDSSGCGYCSDRSVPPPALNGAVEAQSAGVVSPGAHGGEHPLGRRSLPSIVTAPAGDGAIGSHAAGVEVVTGADGGERPLRTGVFGTADGVLHHSSTDRAGEVEGERNIHQRPRFAGLVATSPMPPR